MRSGVLIGRCGVEYRYKQVLKWLGCVGVDHSVSVTDRVIGVQEPVPSGVGSIEHGPLSVSPSGVTEQGPCAWVLDPLLVQGSTAVTNVEVDDSLAGWHHLVVSNWRRELSSVDVAAEDSVDSGGEQHRLKGDTHGLSVSLVLSVGVIPRSVQGDENPRGLGSVDGVEVALQPLSESAGWAISIWEERGDGDEVGWAGFPREVENIVLGSLGVWHTGISVASGDGDDAISLIVGLVVSNVDGPRLGGGNRLGHALEGVPNSASSALTSRGIGNVSVDDDRVVVVGAGNQVGDGLVGVGVLTDVSDIGDRVREDWAYTWVGLERVHLRESSSLSYLVVVGGGWGQASQGGVVDQTRGVLGAVLVEVRSSSGGHGQGAWAGSVVDSGSGGHVSSQPSNDHRISGRSIVDPQLKEGK
jgi:hypothetical protein